MTLRTCDAEPFLRLKNSMVESDHDAEFLDGRKLPIYIYQKDGQTKFMVELEYQFFEAKTVPGFVRLQKQPDAQPQPVEAPPGESGRLKVEPRPGESSFAALKRTAEEQERKARAEQYAARRGQQ